VQRLGLSKAGYGPNSGGEKAAARRDSGSCYCCWLAEACLSFAEAIANLGLSHKIGL
jgi:hypothetical protein